MKEYNLNCPAAAKRIRIGVPATVEFGDGGRPNESTNGRISARLVAEAVNVRGKKNASLLDPTAM